MRTQKQVHAFQDRVAHASPLKSKFCINFTVAINRTDLPPPWPDIGDFKPQGLIIENKWGECRPPLG